MLKNRYLLMWLPIVCCLLQIQAVAKQAPTRPSLKREEMIVLNLNRGPGSARMMMLQSLKSAKDIEHNLDKARHQVEQVDALFAKAANRPDDRSMQQTVDALKLAEETAKKLQEQIEAAQQELRSDVQQTLIK
jgi:hypothetical protein